MELGLSLGERAPKPSFGLMDKPTPKANLGFCMALSNSNSTNLNKRKQEDHDQEDDDEDENDEADYETEEDDQENQFKNKRIKKVFLDHLQQQQQKDCSKDSQLIQLDLLPNTPVPRHNHHPLLWPSSHLEVGTNYMTKGLDVNRMPAAEAGEEGGALSSSPPNSAASSFQMDFSKSGNVETERASSRASDEDENGSTRKKLRLSKEQSAFLEESFKEHNTLNPKQKLALAKQLNLRPRQVEVWFQNRRARTKLKQTEVDCEYLKRCCETLTEENRRLHKELQELRALKTSNPFYMQLPATTLTMCPSCERVASTSTPTAASTTTTTNSIDPTDLSLTTNPSFHIPFNHPTIS